MKQALDLIFTQGLIKEPVIHEMAKKFNVIFNIRRAKVTEKLGEMVLELEGDEKLVGQAIAWLKQKGLKVDSITHDTLES